MGILRIILKEENWDTENQQIYSDIIYSLNRDVVSTSRPIIADVRNPDEITAAFDWVIYQKGSSVIHMIKEPFTSTDFIRKSRTGLCKREKRKQWVMIIILLQSKTILKCMRTPMQLNEGSLILSKKLSIKKISESMAKLKT